MANENSSRYVLQGLPWLTGLRHLTENLDLRLLVSIPNPCQQFFNPTLQKIDN